MQNNTGTLLLFIMAKQCQTYQAMHETNELLLVEWFSSKYTYFFLVGIITQVQNIVLNIKERNKERRTHYSCPWKMILTFFYYKHTCGR